MRVAVFGSDDQRRGAETGSSCNGSEEVFMQHAVLKQHEELVSVPELTSIQTKKCEEDATYKKNHVLVQSKNRAIPKLSS